MSPTFRQRVLVVVEASPEPIKAVVVAQRAGLEYMQAVFALNALHNMDKIQRHGRKLTAMWSRLPAEQPTAATDLETAFRGFFKSN